MPSSFYTGVALSSRTDKWSTPQWFCDEQNARFWFTLDVCASAENAKCARYFTEADDGLAQSWRGEVCWMNPPYGRTIGLWTRVVTCVQSAWHTEGTECGLRGRGAR